MFSFNVENFCIFFKVFWYMGRIIERGSDVNKISKSVLFLIWRKLENMGEIRVINLNNRILKSFRIFVFLIMIDFIFLYFFFV